MIFQRLHYCKLIFFHSKYCWNWAVPEGLWSNGWYFPMSFLLIIFINLCSQNNPYERFRGYQLGSLSFNKMALNHCMNAVLHSQTLIVISCICTLLCYWNNVITKHCLQWYEGRQKSLPREFLTQFNLPSKHIFILNLLLAENGCVYDVW